VALVAVGVAAATARVAAAQVASAEGAGQAEPERRDLGGDLRCALLGVSWVIWVGAAMFSASGRASIRPDERTRPSATIATSQKSR
jgi:cation transporter-like permease